VNVLSVVHGTDARAELFADAVADAGHTLDEWSLAWGTPPPRPIDEYGAVLVFGGAMHADQDDQHPWLRDENLFLAKAAHARVRQLREPEIGWYDVELTDAARDDSVIGRLPERFAAFEWHYYTFDVPAGAVELARSERCTQAFRLGDSVWGVQFHPEVTESQIGSWVDADGGGHVELAEATSARIGAWNELGRNLCAAFLLAAGRVPAPA
jgi:GMP synthase-like glutamine amidotransferase